MQDSSAFYPYDIPLDVQKESASAWFSDLQKQFCAAFEAIEQEYSMVHNKAYTGFTLTPWEREEGGGGVMGLMKGNVFEKVGVNISKVEGVFSPAFAKEVPGAENDPSFWASGISLVAHMRSPHVPAVHMNTRFICTTKSWFGGGTDMTPMIFNQEDKDYFHACLKEQCDRHDVGYYPKFFEQCEKYFYLPHRKEPRGIGGIFYDYHNTGQWEKDFTFTQEVGKCLLEHYPILVRRHMYQPWTEEERKQQLLKRGRYVEFNLLYDRGTRFGLMTGGNVEAIFMSLPPEVSWA